MLPGTRIIVFYPDNGVSEIQKLQMVTQEGNNVSVAAVKGNFDDAQSGVKKIFTDTDYKIFLTEINLSFHLQTQSTGADLFLRLYIISHHMQSL